MLKLDIVLDEMLQLGIWNRNARIRYPPALTGPRCGEPEPPPFSPTKQKLPFPTKQGAPPPEAALSLHQPSSPAQQQLPRKQRPPSLTTSIKQRELLRKSYTCLPQSNSPAQRDELHPAEAASSLLQSSNPAQQQLPRKELLAFLNRTVSPAKRELPQRQPPLSFNRAAPRNGSSPRNSFLHSSIEQTRAAGRAPPEAASSLLQPSSPAQRELPHQKCSFLPSSIEQTRAAAGPPEAASTLLQLSSPAQQELPQKDRIHAFLNPTAPRSGSLPKAATSLPPSSSPAQQELPHQKHPSLVVDRWVVPA